MSVPNELEKKRDFLDKDLYDALRWLFVGAVAWEAARTLQDRCGRLSVLGMLTSFVQARALYEFFYSSGKRDDARARDFSPSWDQSAKSDLYLKYMASEKPANKRVFHLVYGRSKHPGGTGEDSSDHLKNQVVNFARDLRKLTEIFIESVEPNLRVSVQSALQKALKEAEENANHYGISNPLANTEEKK
jgi:hypothetical protein